MEIGEKIFKLRKKNSLSQEELAEKMGVARQTISKWELGETSPDLKQAKELSRIFKVSLDELAGNDIKEVMVEKISNTEKLAGIIIKILKGLGIVFLLMLIIDVIAFILFTTNSGFKQAGSSAVIVCELEEEEYKIEFGNDDYFKCDNCSVEMSNEIEKLTDFKKLDKSLKKIKNYFANNGGNCE